MPLPKYKQRCALCKKNMVLMYSARQFPICTDCHMKRIAEPIKGKKYDFLNIPDELYRESSFLRNIKESFLRFGSLSEKQIEVFKKVVGDLKNPKKKEKKEEEKEINPSSKYAKSL